MKHIVVKVILPEDVEKHPDHDERIKDIIELYGER